MLSIVLAGLVFSPFAGSSGIATYASIRGVVTTGWPSYKPVANAQVVVSGETDWRQTRTDANGNYTFLTLLPGVYHVTVPSYKGLVVMATGRPVTRQCLQDANAPVELSAGLAYFANIDLITHCG
jgi:carboxypeptidase family protein